MGFYQQASRSALHEASIIGQSETVKMLLNSGEDVDQRDQVLNLFYLCILTCTHLYKLYCFASHCVALNCIV